MIEVSFYLCGGRISVYENMTKSLPDSLIFSSYTGYGNYTECNVEQYCECGCHCHIHYCLRLWGRGPWW